jgi:hypothetical protein
MNLLESLAAEWYGYRGYFVRSNVRTGKLAHGGYASELDVLAYSPTNGELVHIETSSDASDWSKRKERMERKFNLRHSTYEKIFNVEVGKVKKIAICGFSYESKGLRWGDIEVKSVREFVREIWEYLSGIDLMRQAVPESYPLLRVIHMSAWATKRRRVRCLPNRQIKALNKLVEKY